ncbi:hypothetical protein GBAR_LOCUS31548 [Geodia barretti]|uniref:Uncharacterized protein n=1 Tax=Geodia barretti TaxID=519541 RepID=A0AA35U3C5_GEOBA|nr:hypothetical protein GBAR_LOCUS31548 [Geodia barretti]
MCGALRLEPSRNSDMSFFNLTHTGVQDPFKTASYTNKDENDAGTERGDARSYQSETNEPGETSVVQQDESTTGPSHVQTMYLPSETGETGRDWHRGSHVRYTELLRKHQRQPQGTASLTHCCNLSLHGEVERVWISCRVV